MSMPMTTLPGFTKQTLRVKAPLLPPVSLGQFWSVVVMLITRRHKNSKGMPHPSPLIFPSAAYEWSLLEGSSHVPRLLVQPSLLTSFSLSFPVHKYVQYDPKKPVSAGIYTQVFMTSAMNTLIFFL